MRNGTAELFRSPLFELLFRAQVIHRESFPAADIQLASLLSIKTGGCPENCAYCPQSAHYKTDVQKQSLLSVAEVKQKAEAARAQGATRFCMGAAWREVKDGPDFDQVLEIVKSVKDLGMETCCTLGMINLQQAQRLKSAGLDAYNHNIDSSRSFYAKIISTRTYDDRLRTIANVQQAGISVCTGGIIGMGESEQDRIDFLQQLADLPKAPESVTINALIPTEGTPLQESTSATSMELARVIACARILFPDSRIRLSAGRKDLTEEGQFLCFLAGANSIFLGDKLLTSGNPDVPSDIALLKKTGYQAAPLRL